LLVVSRMCFSFISSRYSSVSEISFILYGIWWHVSCTPQLKEVEDTFGGPCPTVVFIDAGMELCNIIFINTCEIIMV
jgi:hypothetical protein